MSTDERGTTGDASEPHREAHRVVFPFAFEPAFRFTGLPLGITPAGVRVEVEPDVLRAVFGRWVVETPLTNVAGAEVSGPYSLIKVIGPARLSLADRGLTFATTTRQGVCIRFHEPVRGVAPVGWVKHPALTVTVADPAALAALLDRAGHDHRAPDDEELTVEDLEQEMSDDLQSLTAAELRDRARALGVANVNKLKKAELIDALRVG
jgi:hypothetical protein